MTGAATTNTDQAIVNGGRSLAPRDGVTGAPCVLVVEDDPSIRAFYTTLFVGEGYRVETARDGDTMPWISCVAGLT